MVSKAAANISANASLVPNRRSSRSEVQNKLLFASIENPNRTALHPFLDGICVPQQTSSQGEVPPRGAAANILRGVLRDVRILGRRSPKDGTYYVSCRRTCDTIILCDDHSSRINYHASLLNIVNNRATIEDI